MLGNYLRIYLTLFVVLLVSIIVILCIIAVVNTNRIIAHTGQIINSYEGSLIVGELGIVNNYVIQYFTKNMLFDEKIGGTIHIAVGMGFPECGGKNESALHWDMLCDMSKGKITVDGELFYENGKFVK